MSEPFERVEQESERRREFCRREGYDLPASRARVLELAGDLGSEVLEVGTGRGYMTVALARSVARLTSIDLSPDTQAFVRRRLAAEAPGRPVELRLMDACALDWTDDRFDAVVSVNLVHHLADPLRAVREMLRVCREGGKVVLSDLSARGIDIVDRAYAAEGRAHDRGLALLEDLVAPLAAAGYAFGRAGDANQVVLVGRKQGRGAPAAVVPA